MDYSHYYDQSAVYNTQIQNYQQYWAGAQFGQFDHKYIQHNNYYPCTLDKYSQSHNYQQCSNNLQGLQLAPTHIKRGNRDNRPWKPVTKKRLDHRLLLNGVIIWAYEPTRDEWGLPAKPFICCRTSGGHVCTQRELNYGGYNHPFLVLDHYPNPESREEGDIILEIVPLTSFTGRSILQTYRHSGYCKRMNSLPIEFKSHKNKDRPKEIELLNRLQKPLLGLENSSTSRQLFVEINHIYRVSVKQLHAYGPQKSDASRYVRLNKQGYNEVRSKFILPTDEGIFDKRIETCPRTSQLSPKMGEEPFLKRAEFNLVGFNGRLLDRQITRELDGASLEQPMIFNPVACEFVPSSPVSEDGRPSSFWSWN